MTTSSLTRPTRSLAARRLILTLIIAPIGSVIVWSIAHFGLGIRLAASTTPGGPPVDVGVISVIVAALAAGLIGWGSRMLLDRVTAKSRPVWVTLASVALLLSLAGPAGAVSSGAMIALASMHILVGIVLIAGLGGASPARSSQPG